MTIDRRLIGFEYPEHRATIEGWQLRLFGTAIGVGRGEAAVPPTFGYALKLAIPEPLDRFRALGIDPARVLHGEQSFVYHRPLRPGGTYRVATRVADVYERKGGALDFVVEETRVCDAADELVLTMRSVIVVRGTPR
jgi:hypothetical protein